MLRIYVCEDDNGYRERISKWIADVIMIESLDMRLELSASEPASILSYIKGKGHTGLYFLDVDLNAEIDGIRLAESIREYDPRGFIVFITSHGESLSLVFKYKVEAMDFIVKAPNENIRQRIYECIISANTKYACAATELQENLVVKADGMTICVRHKDILYIETVVGTTRKLILNTVDRRVICNSQLKDIEPLLNDDFYRCHKSVIVNLKMIERIDDGLGMLILMGGHKCSFAVREKRKILERINSR